MPRNDPTAPKIARKKEQSKSDPRATQGRREPKTPVAGDMGTTSSIEASRKPKGFDINKMNEIKGDDSHGEEEVAAVDKSASLSAGATTAHNYKG